MDLLIQYTKEEFQSDLKKIVADAIREHRPEEQPIKQRLFTRAEIRKEFNVSNPTLNRWNKEGILKANKIGGRVLYTLESIEKALNQGQNLKYRRV